ncbi:hypothetical protein [Flavobacterium sp. 83]|uniref:hypothetical protein n=1 Tax=Flavobacterium sp. 83 TaxID=1131812 RepID=UPI0006921EC8|nr:hypothetical protein [Flavobacterium sp. 83]
MIKKAIIIVLDHKATKKNLKLNKLVDDYVNYVKEYIIHYKKSLRGNTISLAKYPYMRAKTEALGLKLNNAEEKELLTKDQIKKILKIKMKIINSCCE